MWNSYELTLQGDNRTNSIVEGLHPKLISKNGFRSSCQYLEFLEKIRQEQKIPQIQRGHNVRYPIIKKYVIN